MYSTHLIPDLKHDFGSRHFAMEEDLQSAIAEFFTKQDAEWYSAGIYTPSHCEVRAVVRFLNVEGVTRLEIHRRLMQRIQCTLSPA